MFEIMKQSTEVTDSIKYTNRECLKEIQKIQKKIYFVKSSNIYLSILHIQQILKKRRVLTFKFDVFERNHQKVEEFLLKDEETTLLIECPKKSESNRKFKEFNFNQLQKYHIIIIGTNEDYTNLHYKHNLISIENQDYTFNDLTEETQNHLLEERIVLFQGKCVPLKNLINRECLKHLKAYQLKKLIKNKTDLEISPKEESSLEDFTNYYIQRQLKRYIQIDRKILENNNNNDFVIVLSEEEFQEKCQQKLEKSIHYLKNENETGNLFWQKSKGSISIINEYFLKNEACCMSIGEAEILDQKESLLIISAEPGMGKSTLLEKLVRDSNPDNFLIKIILNNFTKILKQIKENKIKFEEKNSLEFIFENLMERKLSEFEILILKNLSHQNKLYLMFDGIDEVSDYKEQVKFLIKSIRDSCQLKKVFLTTRNNLREELENYFELISFNLNDFGINDQKSFFIKYWQSLNKNLDMSMLTRLAEELILKLESSLTQLISIPLQTKMIADIFYEKLNMVEEFAILKLSNIADLYHEFIETKFNIQFEQKYKYEIARDQDDYEARKKQFYVDHIKYSSQLLFGNVEPQCQNELDEKRIVKFGFIIYFKNKLPIFLHQSYAEYFVALNAFFKIKQNNDYYDKEFKQILRKNENFLVRKFLDNFMYKDESLKVNVGLRQEKTPKTLSKLILSLKNRIFKRDFKTELENCCKENLFYLLKYLIEKKKAKIKKNEQLLIIASDNGHKDIVELLLDKCIDINQTNEYWKRNALHVASEKGHSEIVKLLIDRGIDINLQDIDGSNALHLAFLNDKRDIVELLIEKGIDIRQQNNFGRNALHCASKSCYIEIVKLLIEKGIDINIKDYDKRNALQWASVRGRKATVELLIEKGIDLNEMDKHGDNALNLAIKNGHKEIAILLIEKGVNFGEKNTTGKSAFDLASELGHKEIVELLFEKRVI